MPRTAPGSCAGSSRSTLDPPLSPLPGLVRGAVVGAAMITAMTDGS